MRRARPRWHRRPTRLPLTLSRRCLCFARQADLDLGNYERFVDITLTRDHNITTGKIYQARGARGGAAAGRWSLPPLLLERF